MKEAARLSREGGNLILNNVDCIVLDPGRLSTLFLLQRVLRLLCPTEHNEHNGAHNEYTKLYKCLSREAQFNQGATSSRACNFKISLQNTCPVLHVQQTITAINLSDIKPFPVVFYRQHDIFTF